MTTIYSNNETININPTDDLVLYKEEFINSRIEKFLYAICALDFDDLPTPLSRIEELYKCLATGLPAPTFVPQSRVEKYLMAILGAYDASALPAPQSRTEVLLNKILLGDTDLSDIEWLKSRYEFLLAYIAKNGENNGDITRPPVYFVDYSLDNGVTTLYNTIEYPVKSAVLKGQTLVNLVDFENNLFRSTGIVSSNESSKIIFTTATTGKFNLGCNLPGLKNNTKYILKLKAESSLSADVNFYVLNVTGNKYIISSGVITDTIYSFTTDDTAATSQIRLGFQRNTSVGDDTDTITAEAIIVEYQDGMENWDIPYFEGMASVEMPTLTTTGKNLFKTLEWESGFISSGDGKESAHDQYIRTRNYIDINPNTTYTATGYMEYFVFYDANKNFISGTKGSTSKKSITFTTPSNAKYLRLRYFLSSIPTLEAMLNTENMLELGEQSTGEYEPYKSTTVSCNEEVELRGIGDVQDELNLVTGELTQRIGEIMLDGSADEDLRLSSNGYFFLHRNVLPLDSQQKNSRYVLCDKLPSFNLNPSDSNEQGVYNTGNAEAFRFKINNITSVEELRTFLQSNIITLQYELITPIIKTIDLSTLDQDGKKTELSTFDDITHVTVSSEGLIPTGDIDIARPIQFVDYSLDNGMTTLYNTIEYPVKNSVLRGDTKLIDELGNECDEPNTPKIHMGAYINEATGEFAESAVSFYTDFLKLPNVDFIVKGNNRYKRVVYYDKDKIYIAGINSTNKYNGDFRPHKTLTRPENAAYYRLSASLSLAEDATYTPDTKLSIVDEYDETLYPTELVSVEMPVLTTTGKNLTDRVIDITIPTGTNIGEYKNAQLANIQIPKGQFYVSFKSNRSQMPLYIHDKKTQYYHYNRVSNNATTDLGNHVRVGYCHNNVNMIIDNSNGYPYMTLLLSSGVSTVEHYIKDFMISSTSDGVYEPHKSNIVSCNEEIELRELDDIKDELNLVTGELTQRIGEIMLDGSEGWTIYNFSTTNDQCAIFGTEIKDKLNSNSYKCDIFAYTGIDIIQANNIEGIYSGGKPTSFFINISKTKASTVAELKNWLSTNNITLQYLLVEPMVKTVDISTLDQDGKETELSTFDDITHVITSSEGLAPDGEITVATKNATDVIDAGIMSLRMDDISNSQRTLEESANAQSDDIDVTMLGVTDIYEQLL